MIPTVLLQAAATAHKSSSGLLDPIAKPIAAVLAAIYSVVPNYGVAILGLSIIWMLIISPLTLKSTRSMLAMQRLQPQLEKLKAQHKDDRQAFAQAQMDLFKEHNVSPFGSCLPMLLPLPVFFALFRVIDGLSHISNGIPTPKYLSSGTRMYKDIVAAHGHLNAFGMDLARNATSSHASAMSAAPYWLLLIVMGATSYFQSAQMMSRNPANRNNPQMRMMKYIPLIFVVFCIRFPAGVVLYYAMSNICRIIQQDAMYRFDPKVKALVVKEVAEVEERTSEIDEKNKRRPGYTPPRPVAETPGGQSGGRRSFRDLWAAAAEQQKAQKAGPAGGAANGNGSAQRNGSGANGSKANGSGANGSGANGSGANRSGANRSGANGSASNGAGSSGGARPGNGSGARPNGAGSGANGGAANGQRSPRPAAAGGRNNRSRTNRKRRGR